jgi:hypothetical protein
MIVERIDFGAQFTDRLAVDLDPARQNHLLAAAPRSQTCIGKEFLQPNHGSIGTRKGAHTCFGKKKPKARAQAQGLGLAFGLAQPGNAVALFPLTAFLEQFQSLKALQYVSFAAQGGGGAQAPML